MKIKRSEWIQPIIEIYLTIKQNLLGGLTYSELFSSDYHFHRKNLLYIYSADLKHQEPLVADIVIITMLKYNGEKKIKYPLNKIKMLTPKKFTLISDFYHQKIN